MYFTNRGHAIHGAYWHNNFGYRMSHGCVNLPAGFAKWLYSVTPMGARVRIHNEAAPALRATVKARKGSCPGPCRRFGAVIPGSGDITRSAAEVEVVFRATTVAPRGKCLDDDRHDLGIARLDVGG